MTDEDLYYEIPGETAPPAAPTDPPASTAPPPAPETPPPPVRPPPSSVPPVPPARKRRNRRLTVALAAIGVILVVGIIAVLSFSVAIGTSPGATAYPYTVTYDVVFPNSEPVQIGNITILAIPTADNVTLSVDKVRYDIQVGERREISAKHATVSLLGMTLLSFDFVIEAGYQGLQGQDAKFALAVRTSEQIPKFMIDRLIPARVQARPA
jgi:hypothetical protein